MTELIDLPGPPGLFATRGVQTLPPNDYLGAARQRYRAKTTHMRGLAAATIACQITRH